MNDIGTADKLLVTAREAARRLSMCEKTLYSLTAPRGPIPVIRLAGRSIRYSVSDLEKFIDQRREGGVIREPAMESKQA